jgi:modification methylase
MATRTRAFGAGNRENHDASDFYARFRAPELSTDDTVNPCSISDSLVHGDARDMSALAENCVALVVTSPPYFAGKEYEQALGEGHVPGTYVEFLAMLRDVFAECHRVLEPGGRMGVNIANLGRKPYRSLSADVMRILQDDLGFLPRGEVVWQKARGATGSIAVGSYLSASNPVLRDLTERVVIVSKGRFDRAIPRKEREQRGLPFENTITKEEFFASTVDLWEIRPEHARRVKHPAPFPVELPERLIRLYTYRDDVVLDPFMGSGSTAVAALRNDRRYVGYDTEPEYVELAAARLEAERSALSSAGGEPE